MNVDQIPCAITILKELKADISKELKINEQATANVLGGVDLAIGRLQKHGFIEVTDEELAIAPLPKLSNQLSFL